jgi:hypothetical protein
MSLLLTAPCYPLITLPAAVCHHSEGISRQCRYRHSPPPLLPPPRPQPPPPPPPPLTTTTTTTATTTHHHHNNHKSLTTTTHHHHHRHQIMWARLMSTTTTTATTTHHHHNNHKSLTTTTHHHHHRHQIMWARLMSFHHSGFLMGASCPQSGRGLVGSHACVQLQPSCCLLFLILVSFWSRYSLLSFSLSLASPIHSVLLAL